MCKANEWGAHRIAHVLVIQEVAREGSTGCKDWHFCDPSAFLGISFHSSSLIVMSVTTLLCGTLIAPDSSDP